MPRVKAKKKSTKINSRYVLYISLGIFLVFTIYIFCFSKLFSTTYIRAGHATSTEAIAEEPVKPKPLPPLDTKAYDEKMLAIANNATTTASTTKNIWPVKAAYPLPGALLPFNRIVAYYGNFYSKGMGVLGQYPEDVMLEKLRAEVKKWNEADPSTPVVPAIDYIATTAQGLPGKEGLYTLRMPDDQIDYALELAAKVDGIVFLEIQPGLSTLKREIPMLEKYLKMPNVHLALDPEFSMKTGARPGTVIGTMDATDINYAADYLAKLVKDYNLPPKILVIHRFTQNMLTNYKQITPLPEVQMIVDMDGWGGPEKKIGTYTHIVQDEPIQFTGFKLFYKNDLLPPSTRMLQPAEILKLNPQPLYIQFQ